MFREHFLTCFIADPIGIELRHDIGIDNIAWECDYPHSDSSWPERARGAGRASPPTCSDDDLAQDRLSRTPCRWYSFDPFAHRSREQSTVAALRAEADGHDVVDQGRTTRAASPSRSASTSASCAKQATA